MKKQYDTEVATDQEYSDTDVLRMEAKGQKLPKRIQKELEGYKTILTKLMHSPDKRESTMEMLKAGPPQLSVPNAALTLNQQAEELMSQKGIKISQTTRLAGSVFLVTDLIDLGNAGAGWETPVDEQEAPKIFQDTLQDYIEKNVGKTLDPIALQQQAEPLMPPEMRAQAQAFGQQAGVPMEVTQQQMLGNQKGMLEANRGGTK